MKIEIQREKKMLALEIDNGIKIDVKPSGDMCVLTTYTDGITIQTQFPSSMFENNLNCILCGLFAAQNVQVDTSSNIDVSGLLEAPKQPKYKPKNKNVELLENLYESECKNLTPEQLNVLNKFREHYTKRFESNWKGKADIYKLWHMWVNNDEHNKSIFRNY